MISEDTFGVNRVIKGFSALKVSHKDNVEYVVNLFSLYISSFCCLNSPFLSEKVTGAIFV